MHFPELNEAQRRAVLAPIDKPILVVAGAGTGKTKTLTARITHLISQHNIAPSAILALTFTNKAAREMEERVASLISSSFYQQEKIGRTFHSLGVLILREQHRRLGIPKHFTILDESDKRSLIKEAMKYHDISTKEWEPKRISSLISRMKGLGTTAKDFQMGENPLHSVTKLVWTRYEELKSASNSLDFDDLLAKTYHLLKEDESIRTFYQKRWQYILVDEYQDTNRIQHEMLRLLLGDRGSFFAVGDGDQNIYSWRGADPRYILQFEKHFPNGDVILLEQNYRSTKNILSVAHHIISKNTERIEKTLRTENEEGEKVLFYEAYSGADEANWVAEKTDEYLSQGVSPDEIAVLFRTNAQSRLLEEAFLRRGIPYHVLGVKFFARKEIKDLISYLRAALNPASLADVKRVINLPKRGLGKTSIARIFAGREEELSPRARESYSQFLLLLEKIRKTAEEKQPSEIIRFIIEESGLRLLLERGSEDDRERLENMEELVSYASKYDGMENALEHFLEEVALLSDQDSLSSSEKSGGKVKLMTIHASKGLEFEYVFVTGLEQGLFPSERGDAQEKHEQEEERRLCYVAFTRAKKRLHLSYARRRMIYGQEFAQEPSEFLHDIPNELLEDDGDTIPTIQYDDEEPTYVDENGVERRSYLDF